MKTMRKYLLTIAATLVAALCIVFGSTLFWIKSNHCLQWVQSRINTAIPGKVAIEAHRLSLIKPSLDLYGVTLHDPQGLALAGVTHLSMGLDWHALLRREIRLERILIQDPWVDLVVDDATGTNLMAALAPTAHEKEIKAPTADKIGLPFNIVFQSILLTAGRFSFVPSDGTTRLEVDGITLSGAGNLMNRSGSLELAVGSVRFNGGGFHPEPSRIALNAHLNGDELTLPALDVTSGKTVMRLSGSAEHIFTTPLIDSVLSVNSQLAELKSIFNLAGEYDGPLSAKLTIKGTVANPDARLSLSVGRGMIAGQPVDRGDLSTDLKDRQATIDTAALRLADGTVTLDGTVNLREAFPTGFLMPSHAGAIDYALSLVQDIPDLNPWLERFVDIQGAASGRVTLSGSGVNPSDISARLAFVGAGHNLHVPGMDQPVNTGIDLAAQIDHGTISISRLKATADGVELSGDARFQMDDGALAGKLSLTADDLSRISAVTRIVSVNGACKAALTVDGTLNRPQFSVDVASKDLQVDAYTLGDLTIKANMDHNGQLNLHTLDLQNQNSRVSGNGRLRLLPGSGGVDPEFVNALTLTLKTLSAADFMETPPVSGTLDGRLRAGGRLGSLTGEFSLSGTALGTGVVTVGEVDARMRLNDGTIFLDRLHLRNQNSTFDVAGRIGLLASDTLHLVENPAFDFTTGSDHLDPGDFIDAASGDFTFTGVLGGSLKKPVGRFTLTGKQVDLAGQAVDALSLEARIEDRRLWLDRFLAAFAPGEQIEGGGWVGLDRTIDLHVKSTGVSSSRIHRLNNFFPGEGVLHVNATGKGDMANPDIQGHLTVSDIAINDGAIEDVNLDFSLHEMLASVTGNLNFEVDAACDLKKGDFDARLTFDHTETASYFKAAGKPDFHGTLTGQLQASGNIRDAVNASANIDLNAFHLMFKDIALIRSDRMVARLADQELIIPAFELALLTTGSLRLKGDARIGGRLNMDIDSQIPLAAAGIFSDELADATGMLGLKGKIAGDTADPQIEARIDLENIGMTVPGLVQKLHDLNGRIHLTQDSIRLDGLNGWLDTGSFSLDGTIAHETFTPTQTNLILEVKALPLEIPDTLAVLLNGDINITGTGRNAAAKGEIVLLEGVYFKDVKINLLKAATGRQRAVPPATRPLSLPYVDRVDLDIVVKHRQPFIVQNNLAQLDISPDLRIGGRLSRPIVSGRAQVKDGTVTFQKKDFIVTKGVIDFVNPYRTEAKIDIQCETTIRTWTIKLTIKGTPENLDLQLSSVPEETDADILSLILFGSTAQELTAGEGGGQRTTGQIMAEMIAETFGEDIKKRTEIDILKVESSGAGDNQNTGGVKVTVGKHLSDRMTVKYAVENNDGEILQRAISEYKLLENILVSGFQTSKGIYGAELVFRIEFR